MHYSTTDLARDSRGWEQPSKPVSLSRLDTALRAAAIVGGGALAISALGRLMGGGSPRDGVWAALGGALAVGGASDFSLRGGEPRTRRLEASVTVGLPRDEVYRRFRGEGGLPRFGLFTHAQDRGPQRVPGLPVNVSWEGDVVEEEEGRRLVWASRDEADVVHVGAVVFRDAPERRGTEVHVILDFRPPGGALGAAASKALRPVLDELMRRDLRRFKALSEAGEAPTTEGQPSARRAEDEGAWRAELDARDDDWRTA